MAASRLVALAASALMATAGSPWPPSARSSAQLTLDTLTFDQKVQLVHGQGMKDGTAGYIGSAPGVPSSNIPNLQLEDGPQGVADLVPLVTAWPSALTVGMSWDTNLAYQYGQAMGAEQAGKGANVQLAPGTNVARVPWNGRLFEYISGEEPTLGVKLLPPLISGIQSNNIAANIKHFVLNSQENERNSASSNVDQRTFMELYAPPFQAAVDAGVASAMCSYNRINGTYACENPETIGWLKNTAGFQGWLMSDWGATHSTIASANAGLDQEMPDSTYFGSSLVTAIQQGNVSQSRLDNMVLRILTAMYAVGAINNPPTGALTNDVRSEEHTTLARTLAEQSTTLLKNTGNLLPLDATKLKSIAVLGDPVTFYGGGSGEVLASYINTPYEAIFQRVNGAPVPQRDIQCTYYNNTSFDQGQMPCLDGALTVDECAAMCAQDPSCNAFSYVPLLRCITFWPDANTGQCYLRADGSGMTSALGVTSAVCAPAPPANGRVNVTTYAGTDATYAAQLAAAADVAIVNVAISSCESIDRTNLSLPLWQDAVVEAAVAANPNTVVIARCAGPCFMPWADKVPAILFQLMPGQEAANAIAAILFGDVNPSGKLPLSFPNNMTETWLGNNASSTTGWPVNPVQYPGIDYGQGFLEAEYTETLTIGYRWYDAKGIAPLWPFGHGLSYTAFNYSQLTVAGTVNSSTTALASFTLQNTGGVDGSEVAQLYIGFPAAAQEPPKLLKDFNKVALVAGASARINFQIDTTTIQIWNVPTQSWIVVPGTYNVYIGSSSADIRLQGTFTATSN